MWLIDRGFREGYFKGAVSIHRGRHEWKAGIVVDFPHLREEFSYVITDSTQFDSGKPSHSAFSWQPADGRTGCNAYCGCRPSLDPEACLSLSL